MCVYETLYPRRQQINMKRDFFLDVYTNRIN